MCREKTPWERAVEFHGHVCPGLTIGFRAAGVGLRELEVQNHREDEALVAIVETDACGVDAVQVLTGCTFGKGNLVFLDRGKQVFTFVRRDTSEGVRVALKYGAFGRQDEHWRMLERMDREQLDKGEREEFSPPEKELFDVRRVRVELPPRARIFPTVQCSECGEGVMEPRARLQKGRVVCSACVREYRVPVTGLSG